MAKRKLCQRLATEILVGDDDSIVIKQQVPNEEDQYISFDRKDAPIIIEMIKDACMEHDQLVKDE